MEFKTEDPNNSAIPRSEPQTGKTDIRKLEIKILNMFINVRPPSFY